MSPSAFSARRARAAPVRSGAEGGIPGETGPVRASTEAEGAVPAADPASAELVESAVEGDREAFRALVESHYAAIFGLCRKLLFGREADAEELTQETFLKAYAYLPTLADPRRFSSWLYQIARSLCRDRKRRWRVEERVLAERREALRSEIERLSRGGGDGTGALSGREGEGAWDEDGPVGAALSDLPEDERRALLLRYFSGLAYEEIARRLGLTFAQVDHLIRKARSRFARRFAARREAEERSRPA